MLFSVQPGFHISYKNLRDKKTAQTHFCRLRCLSFTAKGCLRHFSLLCNPNFASKVRSSFAAAHGNKSSAELLSKLPVREAMAAMFCRQGPALQFCVKCARRQNCQPQTRVFLRQRAFGAIVFHSEQKDSKSKYKAQNSCLTIILFD